MRCSLITTFRPSARDRRAKVYNSLKPETEQQLLGLEDEMLVGDIVAYRRWKHLCGTARSKWLGNKA